MAPIECDDDGLDDIEDMGFLGEMVNAGKLRNKSSWSIFWPEKTSEPNL